METVEVPGVLGVVVVAVPVSVVAVAVEDVGVVGGDDMDKGEEIVKCGGRGGG